MRTLDEPVNECEDVQDDASYARVERLQFGKRASQRVERDESRSSAVQRKRRSQPNSALALKLTFTRLFFRVSDLVSVKWPTVVRSSLTFQRMHLGSYSTGSKHCQWNSIHLGPVIALKLKTGDRLERCTRDERYENETILVQRGFRTGSDAGRRPAVQWHHKAHQYGCGRIQFHRFLLRADWQRQNSYTYGTSSFVRRQES
ncbi:unnamed protein product [Nesidiocoris tenuis]|uniref:Uncharacterized protein n=1 Tax=Nesidiocoris tenuis TaxID=355587 RepID=A0A6H5GB66_9HEMI|nr:unnamed protein product [Nesidiocoris tenuis]